MIMITVVAFELMPEIQIVRNVVAANNSSIVLICFIWSKMSKMTD